MRGRPAARAGTRRRTAAWAGTGLLLGGLLAALLAWPAAWAWPWLESRLGGRVQGLEVEGTVWRGSLLPVLRGGPGSAEARLLPSRLSWAFGLDREGPHLRLDQPGHLDGGLRLGLVRGPEGWALGLRGATPGQALAGRWPAAWLAGLGTPWNTLDPRGELHLHSPGLRWSWAGPGPSWQGEASLALRGLQARVSPLPRLGSYRLDLLGGGPAEDGLRLRLQAEEGPLRLEGEGRWDGRRLRFAGEARADEGSEAALDTLLNILGRRDGRRSILTIG